MREAAHARPCQPFRLHALPTAVTYLEPPDRPRHISHPWFADNSTIETLVHLANLVAMLERTLRVLVPFMYKVVVPSGDDRWIYDKCCFTVDAGQSIVDGAVDDDNGQMDLNVLQES